MVARDPTLPLSAHKASPLLDVQGLSVVYGGTDRQVRVVDDVSIAVSPGEALGVVGESGCGKSQTMLAILRLLPHGGRVGSGRVLFDGRDLIELPDEDMRRMRGRGIAYIAQDALSALNPVMTIGRQMAEPLVVEDGMSEDAARRRCAELLDLVGIPGAAARLDSFPHQLSGGMRQRVLIAMAISCRPRVLIADEPTTALDVTLQAQILALIDRLRRELGMALVLVSHDLGLVAGITDQVAIMYAGRVVEVAATPAVFAGPQHPYTRALLAAIPRLDAPVADRLRPIPGLPPDPAHRPAGCAFQPRCGLAELRCADDRPDLEARHDDSDHRVSCWIASTRSAAAPVRPGVEPAAGSSPVVESDGISVRDLKVHFPIRRGVLRRVSGMVHAVDGVSFSVGQGMTVGLVGESGSGKTTTGRALLGLVPPSGGAISHFGRDLEELRRDGRTLPRLGQMVFQDPYASLNPRMTVGATLAEVLAVHRIVSEDGIDQRVHALLDSVGLRPGAARLHPHELSGGQRQRIAIARALAIEPKFIVCDEVVSALDVSIQGQIINLLQELQRARGLTYLFISHDLSVVRHISHRIVVMYGGKIMETAPRDRLFRTPHHPYTHALLSAVSIPDPRIERRRRRLTPRTDPPDPAQPPVGCRFQRSCRFAAAPCREREPVLSAVADGHAVACHFWDSDEVRTSLSEATFGVAAA
jgi:peptide/nickel transport system ATP-binding protein